MKVIRRALAKVVRWVLAPQRAAFAARGENVLIVEPFEVNYPQRLFLGSDIYIGPHAAFNSVGGIRIGSGSILGPFVHIYSGNHHYEGAEVLPFDEAEYLKPVDIGQNVWIGGDVIILPGVTIGEGAVIAGGAVVIKSVEPGAVVAGFPARLLKMRDMERYYQFKRDRRILNALVGSGRNVPREIGGIPRQWYLDAGVPAPPEAVDPRGPSA
jgi:acetyltransferase-like isoleucine patch superfamily enzyme